MPKISVVIPLWNKEPHIKNTLESVINQTYNDIEILVIDDGSTDKGVDVVRTINDPRIKLIMQKNQGTSAARNRGISEAGSDLIAFLDSDDEWMPTFLETVMRLYNRYPHAGAFATSYKVKMPDSHFEKAKYKHLPKPPWEGILTNYFHAALGSNPVILTSAVMVKKVVFEKVGGFPVGELIEDLDMWARIAFKYPIVWTSRIEAIYRRDVINSCLKTLKLSKDLKVIDTLKEGLSQSSNDIKKDILNLIGKYYKFCSLHYAKNGDRKNAVRCIRESIRYSRGHLVLKPIVLRIILSFPYQVWKTVEHVHSLFNKYYYSSKG